MDLKRFEQLADAYGADLRRWPADSRAAAETLKASSAQARAVLAEADALDALLFESPTPVPSPALRAAVLAAAPKERRARRTGLPFWLSGAGFAAAGVAGVIVGAAVTSSLTADVRTDSVLAEVLPDDTIDLLPINLSRAALEDVA